VSVIEADLIGSMAQFGVAGVMGAMWLLERRAWARREEQLTEAHEKLIGQIGERGALIDVVRDNTRAVALLEAGQRVLVESLRGSARSGDAAG